jgi:hypothetical protein
MEETLFEDPPQASDPPTQDPPQGGGPPAPQGNPADERLSQLESAISETNQALASLTRSLAASMQAANESEMNSRVPVDLDAFRAELVEDPGGAIDRRAQAVVERMAGEQLTPTLTALIDTTHDTLMGKYEALVSNDFGPKAWDEVIKPAIKDDVNRLREINLRALADPVAIKALVDRQIGMNWKSLTAKQAEHAKQKEADVADEISRGLPQGGAPRIRMNPETPNEDIKIFWDDVEKATGQKVDRKEFMAMHNAGNSIDDFLAVTAKLQKGAK